MRRLAALTILVLVAACAPSDSSGGEEESSGDAATPEELVVAVPENVGPLNIFASLEEPLTELVYDKLLAPSPYVDEPQPWLAEDVREIDPSTWEVVVRDDVRWHDGEAFDADDVAFTVEYFKQAPTGRWTHHVSDVPTIEHVDVIAEDTVRLSCASPCPDLGPITLADLPIIPEHVWSEVPGEDAREVTDLPVGTGPYRLTEHDPTSGYRFEAFDDYFAGDPLVDELVMPVIEDPSTAFTALRTGEVDTAMRLVPPQLVEEFEASADTAVATTTPLQFPELRINYEVEPFDVAEVRRALSRAIDRQELLDVVALGQGRVADRGYPHPDSPWTSPDLSTPSDPDEARALLDDLRFTDDDGDGVRQGPDGPLAFDIKVNGSEPTHVRAAELIAEDLAAVGIDATVVPMDAGAIGELFQSRDFELYITTITAHGVADPTQFVMSHRSGYLWRAPELPYPEWEALYDEWIAASTVEERTELLFAMQELFNRQPTAIPLYYPDAQWAYRPEAFDGWVESPGYGIVHKWSLLPPEVGEAANAVSQSFSGR